MGLAISLPSVQTEGAQGPVDSWPAPSSSPTQEHRMMAIITDSVPRHHPTELQLQSSFVSPDFFPHHPKTKDKQHIKREGQHLPKNEQHLSREGHLPKEGQNLPREGHLPKEGQNLLGEEHLLGEEQHLQKERRHPPRKGQRLLKEGKHLPMDGQILPREGQHFEKEGHNLLGEGHLLEEGQHLPGEEHLQKEGNKGQHPPRKGQRLSKEGLNLQKEGQHLAREEERFQKKRPRHPSKVKYLRRKGQHLSKEGQNLPKEGQQPQKDGQSLPRVDERFQPLRQRHPCKGRHLRRKGRAHPPRPYCQICQHIPQHPVVPYDLRVGLPQTTLGWPRFLYPLSHVPSFCTCSSTTLSPSSPPSSSSSPPSSSSSPLSPNPPRVVSCFGPVGPGGRRRVRGPDGMYQDNNPELPLQRPKSPPLPQLFLHACPVPWRWAVKDKSHEVTLQGPERLTALFHPNWSNGTAGVRGTRPINHGVYYWEIRVTNRLFGTSMMFGVATRKARLHADSFNDLLGHDEHSWGLNHRGLLWHAGRSRPYCSPFAENVAVCVGLVYDGGLDTLTFYKDGLSLGVAFKGLKTRSGVHGEEGAEEEEEELFPAAISTAAKTEMTLGVRRRAFLSLQDRCRACLLQQLRKAGRGSEGMGEAHYRHLPLPAVLRRYVGEEAAWDVPPTPQS